MPASKFRNYLSAYCLFTNLSCLAAPTATTLLLTPTLVLPCTVEDTVVLVIPGTVTVGATEWDTGVTAVSEWVTVEWACKSFPSSECSERLLIQM
jgi:hypothetical protein